MALDICPWPCGYYHLFGSWLYVWWHNQHLSCVYCRACYSDQLRLIYKTSILTTRAPEIWIPLVPDRPDGQSEKIKSSKNRKWRCHSNHNISARLSRSVVNRQQQYQLHRKSSTSPSWREPIRQCPTFSSTRRSPLLEGGHLYGFARNSRALSMAAHASKSIAPDLCPNSRLHQLPI